MTGGRAIAIVLVVALAACGVKAPPRPPERKGTPAGVDAAGLGTTRP